MDDAAPCPAAIRLPLTTTIWMTPGEGHRHQAGLKSNEALLTQ